MSATASTASRSAPMVLGPVVITSRTRTRCRSSCLAKARRKSPSVKMPTTLSWVSQTTVMPRLPREIASTASASEHSGETQGRSASACITSRTWVNRRRPSMPPGCDKAKSSGLKPRVSSSAMASASPSASAAVVLAVGARLCGQASRATLPSSTMSASRASVEAVLPVSAIIRVPRRRSTGRMASSSSDSPEYESATKTSSPVTMPRSPWLASAGCTK